MPKYTQHHIHHESADVPAALEWYKSLFDASTEDPVDIDGVPWGFVDIAGIKITVTAREATGVDLGRVKGLDHVGLTTDDFDATMARIKQLDVGIWNGPFVAGGNRVVFINGPDNIKFEVIEQKKK